MSARVYLMKTVNSCKDVYKVFASKDGQVYSVCIMKFSCSQNKQIVNIVDENLILITAFSGGITILNLRIFKRRY